MNSPKTAAGRSPSKGTSLWQVGSALIAIAAVLLVASVVLHGHGRSGISNLIGQLTGRDQTGEVYSGTDSAGTASAGGTGTPSADPSTLRVSSVGSKNGYARARFGQPWTDDVDVEGGHNSCDTRNDILRRDLTGVTLSTPCKVKTGTLADPYTGRVINFVYGKKTSADVQVDHIVALGNVWVSGASAWNLPELKKIANDPLNLLAVDGTSNMSKGDRSADQWLPANAAFQCTYVKRQVQVKNKYHLTVTTAEKATMQRFYGYC